MKFITLHQCFCFSYRWIMEQQQRSWKLIFMAVALLIESLSCVTNSQDTQKGNQQNLELICVQLFIMLPVLFSFFSSFCSVWSITFLPIQLWRCLNSFTSLAQVCVFWLSVYFSLHFRFAYIEFADKESVRTAMALDESLFRGRQIKVYVL